MSSRWLRVLLAGACYILLMWALEILESSIAGDRSDPFWIGPALVLLAVLLPSYLVVTGFNVIGRLEQLAVGLIAATWQLLNEFLHSAARSALPVTEKAAGPSWIVGITLILWFVLVALGPLLVGRSRR